MAGATFGRLKTWDDEVLTNEDLNDEIDNILENLGAIGAGGYSDSVAQMQLQTSPGIAGSESLAASIAGELERIRYVLAQIKGSSLWYDPINNSLATISDSLETTLSGNRIESGKKRAESSQPIYLKPHGTNLTVSVQGSVTPLIFYVDNELVEIDSDVNSPTLLAGPSSNHTADVNDAGIDDGVHTKYIGEFGTTLFMDNAGSEITTKVGQLAAFSINNGSETEYFIARIKSATELTEVKRGFFFNSSDAPIPRIAIADNDVITLCRLTWVFAKTDGSVTFTYNEPIYSALQPSSPAAGDYWFDLTNEKWKIFDAVQFVDANAHFIGRCVQNSTACVAARSADFAKAHSDANSILLEKFDDTQARAKFDNAMVTVYGSSIQYGNYLPRWDMDTDLDTGLTEAADTLYYLYVTEAGKPVISDKCPRDRRGDLKGLYHPHQTWRCVGQFYNNASSNAEAILAYADADELNFAISHKVASSALTLVLHKDPSKPFKLRATSNASGEQAFASVLPGTLLVISSGSTVGTSDGVAAGLTAHIVGYGGRAELALSKIQHTSMALLSTTAEAGNADSPSLLYTFAARSNVPALAIAELQSTQTTAGVWAAALTHVKNIFAGDPIKKRNELVFLSSDTFVVPAGVYVINYGGSGGGGGGGGGGAGGGNQRGGGGGGGSPVLLGTIKVIPGDTLTLTVGAGGTGGAGGNTASPDDNGVPGTVGGNSTISGTSLSLTFGGGGFGGGGMAAPTDIGKNGGSSIYAIGGTGGGSGTGGGGGGGSFFKGGDGFSPTQSTTVFSGAFGGGGGAGGTPTGGTAGAPSIYAAGGAGGGPIISGGGGGASWAAGAAGGPGATTGGVAAANSGAGGGGGGGSPAPNTNGTGGGAGGSGKIILWWHVL